jgi:hypothetical protein
MYDTETEDPANGEVARFNISEEEAVQIGAGAKLEVIDADLVITPVEESEEIE